MNRSALLVALGVSVALNLFGAAALVTTLVTKDRVERQVEAEHRPGRERPAMALVRQLSPEVRDRVKTALRASALAARPDFEEARAKRREAVELARAEAYESDRVSILLDQSRAAELRGRQRLEADAVALLGSLTPADRAALSQLLTRKGRSEVRAGERRTEKAG